MKKARYEYYKEEEVEAFMMEVLEKTNKLKPVFDLNVGYRYPEVEKSIDLDSEKTSLFLERLVDAEILERELYDMEMRCPICNSPNISVNYVCPKCVSTFITKTILFEHNSCGYIGTLNNSGEPLLCPKCKKPLKKGDYRNAGSIYQCSNCQQQIETPFVDHWCRACGESFSFETALYQPKYSYVPAKLTQVEISQGIIYPCQVVNIFEEQGFTRESENTVMGESGVEHVFDLAFKGYGIKFLVDIVYSLSPMADIDVLKNYGKVRDVKISSDNVDVFTVVMPGLDRSAEGLERTYNLNIVMGERPNKVLSELSQALANKVVTLTALNKLEIETGIHETDTIEP